jgi:hypothetical protein
LGKRREQEEKFKERALEEVEIKSACWEGTDKKKKSFIHRK